METKKTVLISSVCAVILGAGIYFYHDWSVKQAVAQYNEEHMTLAEKDPEYATLLDKVAKATDMKDVTEFAEFKKAFSNAFPENSAQARLLKLDNLKGSSILLIPQPTTKVDYFGEKTPDTLYHYKGDVHTPDSMARLRFDISARGIVAEINMADCFRTKEQQIPADAKFLSCNWKQKDTSKIDYSIEFEDCLASHGALTLHVTGDNGSYISIGSDVELPNNATLIINDGKNTIHEIKGKVRDKNIYQITDIEKMAEVFYSPTDEIIISICAVDSKGSSMNFSQKWIRPNIWAAFAPAAGLSPAQVFDSICSGQDFRNIVRKATMHELDMKIPAFKN